MKTSVSTNSYPSDSDIISLLDGPGLQYKWGGPVGTSTDLSFSFASNDTFRIDQAYQDSLIAYTSFYESGLTESIFSDPRYSFRTFTDSQKALGPRGNLGKDQQVCRKNTYNKSRSPTKSTIP